MTPEEQNLKFQAALAMIKIKDFLPTHQAKLVAGYLKGEEWQYFAETMIRLAGIVKSMPSTGETEDIRLKNKVAYLRYFYGGAQWHILEKDKGHPDDPPNTGQVQAFGLGDLGYGSELGYISLQELSDTNKVELDFHFTPQAVKELKLEMI